MVSSYINKSQASLVYFACNYDLMSLIVQIFTYCLKACKNVCATYWDT
jgi:hypothetical protein